MPIVFHGDIHKANDWHKIVASNQALIKLRQFLKVKEPQFVYFLHTLWKNQQEAITYKELRQCILNNELSQGIIEDWQQDYSRFVNRHMKPLIDKAVEAGTETVRKEFPKVSLNYNPELLKLYTERYSARFVTNSTMEQISAVRQAVRMAANQQTMSVDALARAIRPMVGLTQRQTIANMNYFDSLINGGMSQKAALDKSLKYAARQHRYRGQMIARTELAFAYEDAEFQSVRQAQRENLMGHTIKKWCSARDGVEGVDEFGRVCKICAALDGVEKEMDEHFDFPTRLPASSRLKPPAHPHCRCVLLYIETEPPKYGPEYNVSGAAAEAVKYLGTVEIF